MIKIALLGKNIQNSKSPQIYEKIGEKYGVKIQFDLLDFDIDKIETAIRTLRQGVYEYIHVTAPYKEIVLKFADEFSEPVKTIKATNLLFFKNLRLVADNTDYLGFMRSIENFIEIDKKILLLGGGGAAKSALYALRDKNVDVFLRNKDKFDELKRINPNIKHVDRIINDYTNIIQCTSVGFNEQKCPIDTKEISNAKYAYDMIYTPEETLFLSEMKKNGSKVKNGYDMLVYQAEEAFTKYLNGEMK